MKITKEEKKTFINYRRISILLEIYEKQIELDQFKVLQNISFKEEDEALELRLSIDRCLFFMLSEFKDNLEWSRDEMWFIKSFRQGVKICGDFDDVIWHLLNKSNTFWKCYTKVNKISDKKIFNGFKI